LIERRARRRVRAGSGRARQGLGCSRWLGLGL